MNGGQSSPISANGNLSWWHQLPRLGVGLGYRPEFRAELFHRRGTVDFLEIVADHYFDPSPAKDQELDWLREHFTLIPHGLDLSLGSAGGLDTRYLDHFAALIDRIQAPWWSEHVAFTRDPVTGREVGHLTPLPFTWEAVEVLQRNLAQAKARLGPKVLLENITNGLVLPGAELSESEFLKQVVTSADAGLLLDVTNLFINARNQGFDPHEFLDALPTDRVVQLHFVGAEETVFGWADTHAHATQPAIWDLLAEVTRRFPVSGIILERDGRFPPFGDLVTELQQARELWRAGWEARDKALAFRNRSESRIESGS